MYANYTTPDKTNKNIYTRQWLHPSVYKLVRQEYNHVRENLAYISFSINESEP